MSTRTQIIAEPGCTHEGDLDRFFALIDAAAEAGATHFKPQWIPHPEALCERRNMVKGSEDYERYLPVYRWNAYPINWHAAMQMRCDERGLRYACSVYEAETAHAVARYVRALKIASFEAHDARFVEAVVHAAMTIICGPAVWISLGMCSGAEAADAFEGLPETSIPFHCMSAYPCDVANANLRVICEWVRGTNCDSLLGCVGYSDHTTSTLTGALAVAAGATALEKHLRLADTSPSNPDYATALTPDQFAEYVRLVCLAETALGDGIKKIEPCEAPMLKYRVQPS